MPQNMAKQIKIVIRAFAHGISSLGSGWDWSPSVHKPVQRGIGRHFARVGIRLTEATARYESQHRELQHA